ncbi:MAG: HupE/UreJ family protein [Deltaproteobacteria bacterium]|nr:HupE/UreJ family protein [Deltaproteobacteria bacterium]
MSSLQITVAADKLVWVLDLSEQVARQLAPSGKFFEATLASGPLVAGDAPCSWVSSGAQLMKNRVRIEATAHCPGGSGELRWSPAMMQRVPNSFQMLVLAHTARERIQELIFEHGQETLLLALSWPKSAQVGNTGFTGYVGMGIQHIGAAPNQWFSTQGFQLPDGIDHILFLLALLLAGTGIFETAKTVTGFTAGHSLTLALALLGWVRLPSRIIESLIALSIVYVAIEDLAVPKPSRRWLLATTFGLIHGFGFAAALTELQIAGDRMLPALFGFNLGVELGQIVIVLALWPLLNYLGRLAFFNRWGKKSSAGTIAAVGFYWFVRRAFF